MTRIRMAAIYATLMLAAFVLVGCGAARPQSPGMKVEYQEVVKEVPRPCPVARPARPSPLTRPLPEDPGALSSLLIAKLKEWAGAGGYGEKADAAIRTCTRP